MVGLIAYAGTASGEQKPPQQPSEQSPQQPPPAQEEQAPPEEDESEKPKEYSFNPLQAEKEVRIGNFYFHKRKYPAAATRYREATRWNANLPEAYFRLGEAEEKQKDRSEEHTSELQSHLNLVCRLLLEKKKKPRMIPMPAP